MKRFALFILLTGLLTACNNDSEGPVNPPIPTDKPVWETHTHAALLKFRGAVKEVCEYAEEEGERFELLDARFDAAGNCTYYKATGVNPGFGQEAFWYAYTYDTQGRMNSVTRYAVGADPQVYTITYGSYAAYVVAPFPLGDIEPFMLKGVSRIEADGYLLTSDGKTIVEESVTTGWMAKTTRTSWTISDGMPAKSECVVTRNDEELDRIETTYGYRNNWLAEQLAVHRVPEESEVRQITQYSSLWPCSPTVYEVRDGDSPQPQMRIEYRYADNGLPIAAVCTQGTPTEFAGEFQQHYNAYDATGNWTSSTKQMMEQELILNRELGYY